MLNYNLQEVDYELSNELKMNHVTLSPLKSGSETLIRCFTSKIGILSMKLCYTEFLP